MPTLADVFERHVPFIPKRDVLQFEFWKLPSRLLPLHGRETILKPLLGVGIHDVPQMTVRYQDVLPAVEIDVHEHRRPRPAARVDAGVLSGFLEGAVAAIDEERGALL